MNTVLFSPCITLPTHVSEMAGVQPLTVSSDMGFDGGGVSSTASATFEIEPERSLGKILQMNSALEALTGRAAADAATLSLFDFLHPEDTRSVIERLQDLKTVRVIEATIRAQRSNGASLPRQLSLFRTESEGHAIGIANFTGAPSSPDAFPPVRSKLSPQALITIAVERVGDDDSLSTIEFVNPNIRMFGYAPDDLIGKNFTMLLPPEYQNQHNRGIRTNMDTGQWRLPTRWGLCLPAQHRFKSEMTIKFSIIGRVPSGHRVYYTASVEDVTHEKERDAAQSWISELSKLDDAPVADTSPRGLKRVDPTAPFEFDRFSDFLRNLTADPSSDLATTLCEDGVYELRIKLHGAQSMELARQYTNRLPASFDLALRNAKKDAKRIQIELTAETNARAKFIFVARDADGERFSLRAAGRDTYARRTQSTGSMAAVVIPPTPEPEPEQSKDIFAGVIDALRGKIPKDPVES